MIFKTYEIRTKRGVVRGVVKYDKAVVLMDYTDVVRPKDKDGNEIITEGVAPVLYFSK